MKMKDKTVDLENQKRKNILTFFNKILRLDDKKLELILRELIFSNTTIIDYDKAERSIRFYKARGLGE